MYESLNITFQILNNISKPNHSLTPSSSSQEDFSHFFNQLYSEKYAKRNHNTKYSSMETLINHFKYYSEGIRVPRGFVYKAVEAPKGEFGTSLISDGTSKPYRCKIRTPAYHHMQVMSRMVQGHYFADLVTVLGSLDIVFGDVDR
jgi:NADH-quinone oxidoreductase subunit D